MEKFIADFDGSEYSHLARMGLAFVWLRGVEGKRDQARAIELLAQVANQAGDSLSSAAEYHLGTILERQKETVQANYHFQRVLGGTPPLYFKYLAEEALRER
jgi:predicted negative regulator of RcsB-dependent stress response